MGRSGHRQPARRPRDRHQPRHRRDRLGQEGRQARTSSAARRNSSPRRSSPTARCSSRTAPATRGTRGWVAALDVKTGNELWRWYVGARSPAIPAARPGRTITTPGRPAAAASGRPDPTTRVTKLTSWGTGNPVPIYDPQFASGRQPLHQLGGRARRRDRQARLVLPVHAERFVGLRRDRHPHAVRHHDRRRERARSSATSAATGSSTRSTAPTAASSRARQYVNDLNWTKGIDPKTGKPLEYDPKLDVQHLQPGSARAARRRHEARPARPGTAASRTSRWRTIRSRRSPTASAPRAASRRTAPRSRTSRPDGGIDTQKSEKRTYTSDLYYGSITAFDAVNHKVHGEGRHRHRDPLGRARSPPAAWCSPRCRTAG